MLAGLRACLSSLRESSGLTGRQREVVILATAAGCLALGRLVDAAGLAVEAGDEFVGWVPR